jgi:fibronectin-binding autotransporter adhesin
MTSIRRWLIAATGLAGLAGVPALPHAAHAACTVTVSGTVDCAANTVTKAGTNLNGATAQSSVRTQSFTNGAAIAATVEQGVTVSGSGLLLSEGGAAAAPIVMTNLGTITSAQNGIVLQLSGNGGTVTYSGNGGVTDTNTKGGTAIGATNTTGNIAITTGSAAISAATGISASTGGTGGIAITTGGGAVTGTLAQGIVATTIGGPLTIAVGSGGVSSTGVGYDGITATTTSGNISIVENGTVTGGGTSPKPNSVTPSGIYATSLGSGNISVDGSGTVNGVGGRGIWAEQGTTGTGGVTVSGSGNVSGNGTICPGNTNLQKSEQQGMVGCSGIRADIMNQADTGNVLVTRSGNITGTSAAINAITAGNGNVTVLSGLNAQLTGINEYGIEAGSSGMGSLSVTTSGSGTAINTQGVGILAYNTSTKVVPSANSTISVTTTGTITSTGGSVAQLNIKNPFVTLAAISAGYAGGTTAVSNSAVNGSVSVNNGATLSASVGDGILAYNMGRGSIGISNTGAIAAPTGIALIGGVSGQNTIVNAANITGSVAAIDLTGLAAAATVNQRGGTITGDIRLSPYGDTLNVTGGAIVGNVMGDSAARGANAGTVNFNGGTFNTQGTFDVANINVNAGVLVLANNVTVFNAVTNNATLRINAGSLPAISGNYVQGSSGTLAIALTPSGSGELLVGGTASLAGGLTLGYAPGTYGARTYPILSAAGGVGGTFATTSETGSVPTALTRSVTYNPNEVDVVLSNGNAATPAIRVLSRAQVATPAAASPAALAPASLAIVTPAPAATTTTKLIATGTAGAPTTTAAASSTAAANAAATNTATAAADPPGDPPADPPGDSAAEPPGDPPGDPPLVIAPADAALFSSQYATLGLLSQQTTATLLGADGSAACSGPTPAGQHAAATDPTQQIAFCRAGGWMQLADSPTQVSAGNGAPSFTANAIRLLLGGDMPLADGRVRVGAALGYDNGWLNDALGGNATQQVLRVGVYGSALLGPVNLSATVSYAHDWDTTQRQTGIGSVSASHGGDEVGGGVQAGLPIVLGAYTLTPAAGMRFAVLSEDGFLESAAGTLAAFAVSGNATTFNSIVPYARLKLSRDFVTESGLRIRPDVQVGYDYQAGNTNPGIVLTAADGTTFLAQGVALDRSSAVLDAGVSVGRANWAAFANVHANVAGNWSSETIQAGIRLAF